MHREGDERVTPLELFFDLVFVLAVTQCTALMAHDLSWHGLAQGLVTLGVLWWAWVGFAWFTSVLDPEEGAVRGAMFAVIAAFLVASIAIPRAFDDLGLTFAVAYGCVRIGHLVLFAIASRDEPSLRRSVLIGLVPSTLVGVGLIAAASQVDGDVQLALWGASLLLDMGGPFVFGSDGWQLVPGHFAERHGLIVLIALGESIVAIGIGAESHFHGGEVAVAVLSMALAVSMWWTYFDITSLLNQRHLTEATPGKQQNEVARDAYSFLHLPLVAGVVLVALGLKLTLHGVDHELPTVGAAALSGGLALYSLTHVAISLRVRSVLKPQRLAVGLLCLAAIPVVHRVEAWVAVAGLTAVMWAMIAYETRHYAQMRDEVRHAGRAEHG